MFYLKIINYRRLFAFLTGARLLGALSESDDLSSDELSSSLESSVINNLVFKYFYIYKTNKPVLASSALFLFVANGDGLLSVDIVVFEVDGFVVGRVCAKVIPERGVPFVIPLVNERVGVCVTEVGVRIPCVPPGKVLAMVSNLSFLACLSI